MASFSIGLQFAGWWLMDFRSFVAGCNLCNLCGIGPYKGEGGCGHQNLNEEFWRETDFTKPQRSGPI